jgi:hypothetical protein
MFGFGSTPAAKRPKDQLEDVLARHNANMAAERKTPARNDAPPPVVRVKVGFGKRR